MLSGKDQIVFLRNVMKQLKVKDLSIGTQIDCPEHRNLLKVLRGIKPDKRPTTAGLNRPVAKYKDSISRDEYIVQTIAKIFKSKLL